MGGSRVQKIGQTTGNGLSSVTIAPASGHATVAKNQIIVTVVWQPVSGTTYATCAVTDTAGNIYKPLWSFAGSSTTGPSVLCVMASGPTASIAATSGHITMAFTGPASFSVMIAEEWSGLNGLLNGSVVTGAVNNASVPFSGISGLNSGDVCYVPIGSAGNLAASSWSSGWSHEFQSATPTLALGWEVATGSGGMSGTMTQGAAELTNWAMIPLMQSDSVMPVIDQVAAPNGQDSGTTLTVPVPSGVVSGTVVCMAMFSDNVSTFTATPSGWSLIAHVHTATSGSNDGTLSVFGKIATGSDSGNYSLTVPNSVTEAVAWTVQGAAASSVFEAITSGNNASTSTATPSLNITTLDVDRVVFYVGMFYTGQTTATKWTATNGFTRLATTAAKQYGTVGVFYKLMPTAGAVGSTTAANAAAASETAAVMFAVISPSSSTPATANGVTATSASAAPAGKAGVSATADGVTATSASAAPAGKAAVSQFAPKGSSIFADGDFSLTPVAIGDLILIQVVNEDNTVVATSLSSSNATWTPFGTSLIDATNGATAQVFAGEVTSLSADTVTIGWSGTAPTDIRVAGQEFTSVDGTWALDQQGSIDDVGGTNTWASLTPAGPGELYWGFAFDSGTASPGSTAGYTYVVGAHSNGMLYNTECSGATQAPVWGDSGHQVGIMVLVKTSTSTPATANGVTATSASAAPAGSVLARAKAVGVTATSASAAPAGSVLARAKANGVTAASASAAPAGSVLARAKANGVTAASASSAPIGRAGVSVTANGVTAASASSAPIGQAGVSVTANGVTAASTSAAPTGSVLARAKANGVTATSASSAPTGFASGGGSAVALGVTARSASAAPTGTVLARAKAAGVTATSSSAAPIGHVGVSPTANGVTATSASAAPAGSVLARAKAAGVTATSSSAAPAGSVLARATVNGVTATSASSAPAGSAGVNAPATANGVTATSVSTASAGSVLARATANGVTAISASAAHAGTATGTATRPLQAGKLKITNLLVGKLTISDVQPKVVVTEVSGGRVTIN